MLSKESGTKIGATVRIKYEIQLKKAFAATKINTSVKNLQNGGNTSSIRLYNDLIITISLFWVKILDYP